MKSRTLNLIGLALGICGVFMLFKWGPPQPSFTKAGSLIAEDNTPDATGKTVAEYDREIKSKEIKYSRISKLGLILIALGFTCQFIAVLIDN